MNQIRIHNPDKRNPESIFWNDLKKLLAPSPPNESTGKMNLAFICNIDSDMSQGKHSALMAYTWMCTDKIVYYTSIDKM